MYLHNSHGQSLKWVFDKQILKIQCVTKTEKRNRVIKQQTGLYRVLLNGDLMSISKHGVPAAVQHVVGNVQSNHFVSLSCKLRDYWCHKRWLCRVRLQIYCTLYNNNNSNIELSVNIAKLPSFPLSNYYHVQLNHWQCYGIVNYRTIECRRIQVRWVDTFNYWLFMKIA